MIKKELRSILLIDDDKNDNFYHEREILKAKPGLTIITKNSGMEALEFLKASRDKPQLIFLDINMPVMDGIEATKKANLLYRDINIIAVSFHDEMKFIKQMIEAGAKNYVIKEDLNKSILEKIILRH